MVVIVVLCCLKILFDIFIKGRGDGFENFYIYFVMVILFFVGKIYGFDDWFVI